MTARVCSTPGCPAIATQEGRCPTHARPAWREGSSTRKATLPKGWGYIRGVVLEGVGYRCQCSGCPRCMGTPCQRRATDVDHIGDRNDHRLHNLQALCGGAGSCHAFKSSSRGTG